MLAQSRALRLASSIPCTYSEYVPPFRTVTGIIVLTHTAKMSLQLKDLTSVRSSSSKARNHGSQLDQILDQESRSARASSDPRILGQNVRPACGQRCHVPRAVAVEDPIFTPLVSANDNVELLSALRMKRVHHPDGPRHLRCVECSSLGDRRTDAEESPSLRAARWHRASHPAADPSAARRSCWARA
jgi:hypothetical protein